MAVKYRIIFRDHSDVVKRVDIATDSYNGEPLTGIPTVSQQAVLKSYDGGNTNPFETYVVASNLTINIRHTGIIDIAELQTATDFEFKVFYYENNVLDWVGYLQPDGIVREHKGLPSVLRLTCTDGLRLLEGIDFTGLNNWPMPIGVSTTAPLAYIREVLFRQAFLNLPLPIAWVSSVVAYDNTDAIAGTMEWGSRGEAFYSFQKTDGNSPAFYESCLYVLENLLKAFSMRIFQDKGYWKLQRINNITTGQYTEKQISTEFNGTDIPTLTTVIKDVNRTVMADGNYGFIQEDATVLVEPAIRSSKIVYAAKKPENIIPNGSMDRVSLGQIFGWSLLPANPNTQISIADSLDGRYGNSAEITFFTDGTTDSEVYFTPYLDGSNRLPIDTKLLFKTMRFGFSFCPLNGFPYFTDTGFIDWSSNPLRVSLRTTINGKEYVLTENGYWMPIPTGGTLNRYNYTAYSDPNDSNILIIDNYFSGSPIVNDWIGFNSNGVEVSRSYCPLNSTNDLVAFLTYSGNFFISDSNSDIFSYEVLQDGTNGYILRCRRPNGGVNIGMTWGLSASMRDGTISISVAGMRIGDIATVNFGEGRDIKLLEPNELLPDECYLEFRLYLKEGQRMFVDDVYVNVPENSDVYESIYTQTKYTQTFEDTMQVSSAFSGFLVSNLQTDWPNSSEEYIFNDSKYTGSLTGMYANAVMRYRYQPCEIFTGSIHGQNWSFTDLYTIAGLNGKKYLPLSAEYNAETNVINITAGECRDGNIVLTERHYGSNDNSLSN